MRDHIRSDSGSSVAADSFLDLRADSCPDPDFRKVFISNGGVDPVALLAFRRENEPNKPYNRFYDE